MTIYYVLTGGDAVTGGLAQTYRHVRILSERGYDARALFLDPEDRAPQSAGKIPRSHLVVAPLRRKLGKLPRVGHRFYDPMRFALPIIDAAKPGLPLVNVAPNGVPMPTVLSADDILVLPEFLGPRLRATHDSVPVVVFNQGPHLSFQGAPPVIPERSIYTDPILGVITVSDHAERYLSYGFPKLTIIKTPNAVDQRHFRFGSEKRHELAFMPRKLPEDLAQVFSLLAFRGALRGWSLRPLEGRTSHEVAEVLRGSWLFLSSLSQEGFGLPPLEAALCGCVVVGYTGFAAAEFMDPAYCFPIPERDVLAFARTLETLLREIERRPAEFTARCRAFSEQLAVRYSEEGQARAVLSAWEGLLEEHRRRQAPAPPTGRRVVTPRAQDERTRIDHG